MPASGELARRVVEAGRRCSLTTSVLGEWASAGSPKQVEYLARYLEFFPSSLFDPTASQRREPRRHLS